MLQVQNVTKQLKQKVVLDDVSVTIQPNDYMVLKGHNGSGKTMLLRLLAGLIVPTTGSLSVDPEVTFGVIIEHPSFLLGESALYNLKYLAAIRGKLSTQDIEAWLKRFGLYEVRHKKVRSFSLGMKQRLAIVQALMEEPDVLLLDEPFNAIDDANLAIIFDELNHYHEQGHTIVIATHGDYEGQCHFNRKCVMNLGQLTSDERIDSGQ